MKNIQFIQCSDSNCPMNEAKSCRAPFIMVDDGGKCFVRNNGPHEGRSHTDNYVEIKACACQSCHHWEPADGSGGACGLASPLFFNAGSKGHEQVPPVCRDFEKQIQQPGFSAVITD